LLEPKVVTIVPFVVLKCSVFGSNKADTLFDLWFLLSEIPFKFKSLSERLSKVQQVPF